MQHINTLTYRNLFSCTRRFYSYATVVVDCVPVEHRLFRYSRKRQSQKTGSYTETASLACFQWLPRYIISPPHKTGNALPRHKYSEISIALHLRVSSSLRSLAKLLTGISNVTSRVHRNTCYQHCFCVFGGMELRWTMELKCRWLHKFCFPLCCVYMGSCIWFWRLQLTFPVYTVYHL